MVRNIVKEDTIVNNNTLHTRTGLTQYRANFLLESHIQHSISFIKNLQKIDVHFRLEQNAANMFHT